MFRIPLPTDTEHHTTPRNNRDLHRIISSFHIFPGLFHQSFLGRASTRHGSRKEKLFQSRIGSPRRWNLDRRCRLHFVEFNRGSLRSGILYDLNDATGVYPTRAVCTPTHRYRRDRGIVVGHLDRAGKERDLAARRAIQAKSCHSMVRYALKIEARPPNPDVSKPTGKPSVAGFHLYSSCPLDYSPSVCGCGR